MTPTAPNAANPANAERFGVSFLHEIPKAFREYFKLKMLTPVGDEIIILGPSNAECGHSFTFLPTEKTKVTYSYNNTNDDDDHCFVTEMQIHEPGKYTITLHMGATNYKCICTF